jgi:hypothetical protein
MQQSDSSLELLSPVSFLFLAILQAEFLKIAVKITIVEMRRRDPIGQRSITIHL